MFNAKAFIQNGFLGKYPLWCYETTDAPDEVMAEDYFGNLTGYNIAPGTCVVVYFWSEERLLGVRLFYFESRAPWRLADVAEPLEITAPADTSKQRARRQKTVDIPPAVERTPLEDSIDRAKGA